MDYLPTNALRYNMTGICHTALFYDINCSYMQRLYEWVSSNASLGFPTDVEIVPPWSLATMLPKICTTFYSRCWLGRQGNHRNPLVNPQHHFCVHPHNVCSALPRTSQLSDEQLKFHEDDPDEFGSYSFCLLILCLLDNATLCRKAFGHKF